MELTNNIFCKLKIKCIGKLLVDCSTKLVNAQENDISMCIPSLLQELLEYAGAKVELQSCQVRYF